MTVTETRPALVPLTFEIGLLDASDWVAVAVETEADAGNWTLTTYALCAD